MNLFTNVKLRHSLSLRPNLKWARWGVKVRNESWVSWFVAIQACRGDISSQDLFCWSSSQWVSALKIRVMAVPSWELTGRFKRQRQGGWRWEDREGALLRLLMTVEKNEVFSFAGFTPWDPWTAVIKMRRRTYESWTATSAERAKKEMKLRIVWRRSVSKEPISHLSFKVTMRKLYTSMWQSDCTDKSFKASRIYDELPVQLEFQQHHLEKLQTSRSVLWPIRVKEGGPSEGSQKGNCCQ